MLVSGVPAEIKPYRSLPTVSQTHRLATAARAAQNANKLALAKYQPELDASAREIRALKPRVAAAGPAIASLRSELQSRKAELDALTAETEALLEQIAAQRAAAAAAAGGGPRAPLPGCNAAASDHAPTPTPRPRGLHV